jgi:hypothetical protein
MKIFRLLHLEAHCGVLLVIGCFAGCYPRDLLLSWPITQPVLHSRSETVQLRWFVTGLMCRDDLLVNGECPCVLACDSLVIFSSLLASSFFLLNQSCVISQRGVLFRLAGLIVTRVGRTMAFA